MIVLANVDPDLLTSQQLAMTREFVGVRGGGLLVLGARGFQRQGLRDTALEEVLPLAVADKTGGIVQVSSSVAPGRNRVALTPAGEDHPVMQLAANAVENDKKWAAVPALAAISPLGSARPGASVLAVTGGPSGPRALVAVQRFGDGRSMVFTGEASWRWRMMLPTSDRIVRAVLAAGRALARAERAGARDDRAAVGARPRRRHPGRHRGARRRLRAARRRRGRRARDFSVGPRRDRARRARAVAAWPVPRVRAGGRGGGVSRRRRGAAGPDGARHSAGTMLVGGVDPEMTDPRLNEDTLQRVARASGGAVLAARRYRPAHRSPERRGAGRGAGAAQGSVAHGMVVRDPRGLLAAEWLTRRAWGLR